jgi:hypothetical protein
MMTSSELARLRRQMQRRIRVVLAQRRVDTPVHAQRDCTEHPPGDSGEPAPQD